MRTTGSPPLRCGGIALVLAVCALLVVSLVIDSDISVREDNDLSGPSPDAAGANKVTVLDFMPHGAAQQLERSRKVATPPMQAMLVLQQQEEQQHRKLREAETKLGEAREVVKNYQAMVATAQDAKQGTAQHIAELQTSLDQIKAELQQTSPHSRPQKQKHALLLKAAAAKLISAAQTQTLQQHRLHETRRQLNHAQTRLKYQQKEYELLTDELHEIQAATAHNRLAARPRSVSSMDVLLEEPPSWQGEKPASPDVVAAVQEAERVSAQRNSRVVADALEGLSTARDYAAQIQHSMDQLNHEAQAPAQHPTLGVPPAEDLVQPLAHSSGAAWSQADLLRAVQREDMQGESPPTSLIEEDATTDEAEAALEATAEGAGAKLALHHAAKLEVLVSARQQEAQRAEQAASLTAQALQRTMKDQEQAGNTAANSMIAAARAQYEAKLREKKARKAARAAVSVQDPTAKKAAQRLSIALKEEALRSEAEAHTAITLATDTASMTKAKVKEVSDTQAEAATAAQKAASRKATAESTAAQLRDAQEAAAATAQLEADHAESTVEAKQARAKVIAMKKKLVQAATKQHLERINAMMAAEKVRSTQLEGQVQESLKSKLSVIQKKYADSLHAVQGAGDMWAGVDVAQSAQPRGGVP